jgi:peptidoglycan hydrolase-like protein with peptidoglycan-binding domain
MNLKDVQTKLKALTLYDGDIDGLNGKKTKSAINAFLLNQGVRGHETWPLERLVVGAMQLVVKLDGIDVGAIDGYIGTQTRYGLQVWDERRSKGTSSLETFRDEADKKPDDKSHTLPAAPTAAGIVLPKIKPTWPTQAQCTNFFGNVGTNQTMMQFPYPMRIAWDTDQTAARASCHEKCKVHFERIFKNTLEHYGHDQIRKLKLDMFGGLLNVRKMRGGSSWSMHAWGIAIDIDPERNQLQWGRDRATLDNKEYDAFWSFVEAEGGVSLGRLRNYDWMHFQFARL